MNKHLYVIILAGGSGTRFWPLSRENQPKQFLNMAGKKSLIESTLSRLRKAVNPHHMYLVANQRHKNLLLRHIDSFQIPPSNIFYEPVMKNTAPAIAWAAHQIYKRDPHGVMAVFPSDHIILKEKRFLNLLNQAKKVAEKNFLVTFGIVPTRPETGYGYLKTKAFPHMGKGILKVNRFIEKPEKIRALKFLKSKNYLWNSGMFVWKAGVILEEFQRYQPEIYHSVKALLTAKVKNQLWKKLPSLSIDYAILEKSNRVVAVAASHIGWSDVGSWEALAEILSSRENGNVVRGFCQTLDCQGTYIHAPKRFVGALGLKNVIIVDCPDALLVCSKSYAQRIREVVRFLKIKKPSLT